MKYRETGIKKTEQLRAKIPDAMMQRLDRFARKWDVTRSSAARRLIAAGMERAREAEE